MKYRNIERHYQLGLDDMATKDISPKTTEPITAMRLNISGTNGSTSNKSNFINDVLTKIEIKDGSDELISLSMKAAQAIQFRRTGKMPHVRPGELNGGSQEESCLILFGRYLNDPEYYMDFTKFKNPEIYLTSNIAAVRATGNDAFVSNSLKATIDLLAMPDVKEAAKGFLMYKTVDPFTSGSSGDKPIELPIDYQYVALLLRAYAANKDIDENISKLKLSCDTGKFVPIEKYVKDLYRWEEEDYGPASIRYYLFRKDGETVKHIINHDPIVTLTPWAANRITGALNSWSSQLELFLKDAAGAPVTSEEMIGLTVKGSCPHSTVYLPFGDVMKPDTYFNPKEFQNIDLILTQAYASAVEIAMIQLRPYAPTA